MPLLRRIWRLARGPGQARGALLPPEDRRAPAIWPRRRPREIPIYTAGVNPRMIESAGRVADGLLGHTLFSPRYIDEVVRPAIERAPATPGATPATSRSPPTRSPRPTRTRSRRGARRRAMIAFYGSVKSYGNLFEVCGFGREAQGHAGGLRAPGRRSHGGRGVRRDDRRVRRGRALPRRSTSSSAASTAWSTASCSHRRASASRPERVAENLATLVDHCARHQRPLTEAQRPCQRGARFSANARGPSWASSLR